MNERASDRSGPPPWTAEIVVLLAYAALALAQTGITSDPGSRCYGGCGGDSGQDIAILFWVSGHLLDPTNVFEGTSYYPSHKAILFTDPLLGPAVLVAPVRLFSRNPVLLHSVAILLVLTLSSWGFYRLAVLLFGDRRAALLAGITIPYTALQTTHLGHLNLLTISFFPFLITGLLRLLQAPRMRWALLVGVSFALQAGTSGYHAFSSAFLAACIAAWEWRQLRRWQTWLWCTSAAALATILLLPYVLGFAYLREHEADLARSPAAQAHYSLDFPASLLATDSYLLAGVPGSSWTGFRWVRGFAPMFPGVTVVVLAAVAFRRGGRDRHVRLLAVLALIFCLLALGPQVRVFGHVVGPGPFVLLRGVLPFFGAVRHPLTFMVPAFMALGLLGTAGLHFSGLSRSRPATLGFLLLATIETLGPRPPRTRAPQELPQVYRYLLLQQQGGLLELPSQGTWHANMAYPGAYPNPLRAGDPGGPRWWSMFHGMPVVNGGGAFEPEAYTLLAQWVAREWKRPGPRDLSGSRSVEHLKTSFPARYLVVGRAVDAVVRENVAASVATFELLYESPPGDRVYRIHRGGAGPSLARQFREDQLEAGQIRATVRGRDGVRLKVIFNGAALEERSLTVAWTEAVWEVPRGLVRYGMNELRLETPGPEGDDVVELKDLEAR